MESKNKFATISLVLGIISIIAWLLPLAGYPVTILAIVFGTKGRSSAKKGMATAGMILGIIFLVITCINSVLGAIQGLMFAM